MHQKLSALVLSSNLNKTIRPYLIFLFTACICLAATRIAWISDDAFITLRVIKNFISGHGLRYNRIERVQVFTHPLWLFVLSLSGALGFSLSLSAIILSISFATGMALLILTNCSSLVLASTLTITLILSNTFLDFASSGLETGLNGFLLAILIRTLSSFDVTDRQRSYIIAVFCSLLLINRFDNTPLLAPILIYFLIHRHFRSAFLFVSLPLLWIIFSIIYYGFPFPNTYYAKSLDGIVIADRLSRGIAYLQHTLLHDPFTATCILIGGVAGFFLPRMWMISAGIILHLLYVVSIGGDFMAGRFLFPTFAASIAILSTIRSKIFACSLFIPVLLGGFTQVFSGQVSLLASKNHPEGIGYNYREGIYDERAFYFFQTRLVTGDYDRYRPVELDYIRRKANHSRKIAISERAGKVGYLLGPRYQLIDLYGITDLILPNMSFVRKSWRTGHLIRRFPEGYLNLLRGQKSNIQNRAMDNIVHQFWILSRGPILSVERVKTIACFLFGPCLKQISIFGKPPLKKVLVSQKMRYFHSILPWGGLQLSYPEPFNFKTVVIYLKYPDEIKLYIKAQKCEKEIILNSTQSKQDDSILILHTPCSPSGIISITLMPQSNKSFNEMTLKDLSNHG